jgi:hypothetical protein
MMMPTTLTYLPNEGVQINSVELKWSTDRELVRQKLPYEYEEKDSVMDMSQYGGNVIVQKRDVYKNINGAENFFFLNYDGENRLSEVELHHGFEICISQTRLTFDMLIDDVVERLSSLSHMVVQLAEGEYFYKELKLTIASADAMGGDGEELSYFYCAKNVDHLMEEN